jgi:hypothetical protein
MKSKTTVLIPTLAALVACAGTAFAQTEILTFDNLPGVGGYNQYLSIPNGYGRLQWQNLLYMDGLAQIPSGYLNGVVSPNNIAFNGGGNPGLVSDGSFNLNSAYLTAAWNDGLQVEVQGFVGGALVYDNTYTVNTTGPTSINLNYTGIDQLQFISFGGTPHPGLIGSGEQFVMDNLSITFIPEPSTFALIGLAAMSLILRRRTPSWSQRPL